MRQILLNSIRKHRKALNLTQKELGESAGLSGNAIAQIERGQRWPSLATLDKISKRLGLETFELFKIPSESTESVLSLLEVIKNQEKTLEGLKQLGNDSDLLLIQQAREISPSQFEMILGLAKIIVRENEEEESKQA